MVLRFTATAGQIVREAYPDPSQFDPGSKYHDAASTAEAPKWVQVDCKLLRRLRRQVGGWAKPTRGAPGSWVQGLRVQAQVRVEAMPMHPRVGGSVCAHSLWVHTMLWCCRNKATASGAAAPPIAVSGAAATLLAVSRAATPRMAQPTSRSQMHHSTGLGGATGCSPHCATCLPLLGADQPGRAQVPQRPRPAAGRHGIVQTEQAQHSGRQPDRVGVCGGAGGSGRAAAGEGEERQDEEGARTDELGSYIATQDCIAGRK